MTFTARMTKRGTRRRRYSSNTRRTRLAPCTGSLTAISSRRDALVLALDRHFDDARRVVRALLQRHDVAEGAGLLQRLDERRDVLRGPRLGDDADFEDVLVEARFHAADARVVGERCLELRQ